MSDLRDLLWHRWCSGDVSTANSQSMAISRQSSCVGPANSTVCRSNGLDQRSFINSAFGRYPTLHQHKPTRMSLLRSFRNRRELWQCRLRVQVVDVRKCNRAGRTIADGFGFLKISVLITQVSPCPPAMHELTRKIFVKRPQCFYGVDFRQDPSNATGVTIRDAVGLARGSRIVRRLQGGNEAMC